MSSRFLATRKEWKKLVNYIYSDTNILAIPNPIGLDSEFEGVDFDAGNSLCSCVGTARLDVWSIGIYTGRLHPRGYEIATGYVLPRESLEYFKGLLEDGSITKAAHNSTVDVHTFYNAGTDVSGIIDTLHLTRFAFPGRFKYGLDALSKEFLDESKFTSFHELVSVPRFVQKEVKVKRCICGEEGCRKRKNHDKYITLETVDVEHGTDSIPISTIRPGHAKWGTYVDYAGQDAVLALELYDYTTRRLKKLNYENPFRFDKQI